MAYQELTVIVPTLNEVGNVKLLHAKVASALSHINFEMIFVDDDSTDGTVGAISELVEKHSNVRLIRRIGRRGISSAFVEATLSSSMSAYIAIIDADLQHDETLLSKMLNTIKSENLDLVICSRFKDRADEVQGLSKSRERLSKLGNYICRLVSGTELTDPMSGFFMIRREIVNKVIYDLSAIGFKILLDILASCHRSGIKLKLKEIAMEFRKRNSGQSKLDVMILSEFMMLVADKLFGKFIPVRFILFILVGLSGVFVHASALAIFKKLLDFDFLYAQTFATIIAMTSNFFLNNIFTYRDRRLSGFTATLKGLLSFYGACAIGALINIATADFLYVRGIHWLISGIFGGIVGAGWNYGITSYLTWGKAKRHDIS